MKPIIRILSLSALVLVALLAALYFALPSNKFRISFPEPGIGTPSPWVAGESNSPAAPVLMATAGADLITISWQQVEGANGYELYGRHGALPWQRLDDGSLTGSSTSFTHTELASETTYFYTGRTVPATGRKSPWAVQVSAIVFDESTVPALTASPSIGQIQLNWNAVTGADSYHLIMWTDVQENWERIGDPLTGTTTSYTHSELTAATTYHYRVRAVSAGTEGEWSDAVSAAPSVPAAPTLTATAAAGHVDLNWSSVTGADSYHLIMWTEDQEDWERIGDPLTGTTTSYAHTELTPDQSYFYSVRAVVDGTEGSWSERISSVPFAPAPPTLSATPAAGQIVLSWTAATDADSYHLIVWTDAQNAWVRIGDPLISTTTSYTHTALTADQSYYYRISAVIHDIGGEWSNSISAVTSTSSTLGLTATAAAGQVELTWTAATGADSYQLIMWTEGQAGWVRIGDPLTSGTTSYTHSGPTAGSSYYYRVRAVVDGTEGSWSEQVAVTP